MERHELEITCVSFFVVLVVIAWKFATRNWSIAAAFGSLVFPLITLAHSRSKAVIGDIGKGSRVD